MVKGIEQFVFKMKYQGGYCDKANEQSTKKDSLYKKIGQSTEPSNNSLNRKAKFKLDLFALRESASSKNSKQVIFMYHMRFSIYF